MREGNRYIIFIGIFTGCLSSLYFLSLLFPVPFFLTVLAAVVSFGLLFKWIIPGHAVPVEIPAQNNRKEWIALLLLAVGVSCLCFTGLSSAGKYGDWDAWSIWNLNAEYLADPIHWRKIFQNVEYGHPDYPLCLPATLAFFMRLASSPDNYIIPFAFSLLIAICIPVLIFREIQQKNLPVATLILALFVIESFYIINSMLQYADVLLSFFFLCSLICVSYARGNRKYLLLSVLFLGCCAWTKNEGFILAGMILSFYARQFFSKENARYTLLIMLIPAFVIVVFKMICPVKNDLVSESGSGTFGLLLQGERYAAVFDYYTDIVNKRFVYTRLLIGLYLVVCVAKRKLPEKNFLLVIACMFAYFMVYVITPKDLLWHLNTSCERLLFQLFPVLLYAIGSDIAGMKFSIPGFLQQGRSKETAIPTSPQNNSRSVPAKGKHR